MATREEIADILAGFTLFGDLQTPQRLGVASIFDEVVFPSGEPISAEGLTGSGFYVILDGTADVRIDGQQRATLGRGDFFGEVSILLGEPPTADVVATTALRTIQIAGSDVQGFLVDHPQVMYRMLQAQDRCLRPRSAAPAVGVAESSRLRLEHPVHDLGTVDEESLDVAARDLDGPQRGWWRRRRRLAAHPGRIEHLTEEIAPPEGRALLPIDADVRGAVEDHVEADPVSPWRRSRSPDGNTSLRRRCWRPRAAAASGGRRTT